jgi:GNAT superfamily N-acetyltransferase
MSDAEITFVARPEAGLRDAILKPLLDYNTSKVGVRELFHFAFFVRSSDEILGGPILGSPILGGLWARSFFDWTFVELLVVPETMRGQGLGTKLLAQAEAVAREHKCVGIYLDTFSFQARGFYEKHGYGLFGTLENYPDDEKRFFLSKRF